MTAKLAGIKGANAGLFSAPDHERLTAALRGWDSLDANAKSKRRQIHTGVYAYAKRYEVVTVGGR